jgi:hypothetical protein
MRRYWDCFIVGAFLLLALPAADALAGERQQRLVKGARGITDAQKTRVYIQASNVGQDRVIAFRKQLIERGAQHVNYFPPGIIVCEIDETEDVRGFVDDPGFTYFEESQLGPETASPAYGELGVVRGYYEKAKELKSKGSPALAPGPDTFTDVVVEVPPEVMKESADRIRKAKAAGADVTEMRHVVQNAEFIIGDVLCRTIYPESDFGHETWTDQELADVKSGVVLGMLSFQGTFGFVPLHFVFDFAERVQTSFEPINHQMETDPDWIADVMNELGYAAKFVELAVHEYNEAGRRQYGTDWVFTAFIADSRNTPNHRFGGGSAFYTAYANLGGPYLVQPFPAGQTNPHMLGEITLFQHIFQHESIHIFWGLDEYTGDANMSSCTSRTGYLDYPNRNRLNQGPDPNEPPRSCPGWNNVPCLMWDARNTHADVCHYTRGTMGVVDADDNAVPDIFDMPPTIEFEGALVETVLTPNLTINMKVVSQAVPNQNRVQASIAELVMVDYAPPLGQARLKVNGVGDYPLQPMDGKWDELEEDMTFKLTGIAPGLTRVQVRAKNSFGKWSGNIVKKIYFVGINYTLFDLDPGLWGPKQDSGIRISWRTVGDTFNAVFDLKRIEFISGRPDTVTLEAGIEPHATTEVFREFRYWDMDVTAGQTYHYFVEANFTIWLDGRLHNRTFYSRAFEARAMFDIDPERNVSYVSPNPFREKTQLSFRIPPTFVSQDVNDTAGPSSASAVQQIVETPVSIIVYDVLGRPVKKVYRGRMFAQVETFTWDGTNSRNERVPSGVYFIQAVAGNVSEVKKAVVVR